MDKEQMMGEILLEQTIDAEIVDLHKNGLTFVDSNKLLQLTDSGKTESQRLVTKCIALIDGSEVNPNLISSATESMNKQTGLNLSPSELFTNILLMRAKTECRLLAFLTIEERTSFVSLISVMNHRDSGKPKRSVVKKPTDPNFH